MASKIPRSIQEKAIGKWLDGKPRDLIARELQISSGSASSIIQGRRRKDREFDLLRVVAIKLREQGLNVESFAPLIRIRKQVEKEHFQTGKTTEEVQERIDSLLEALCVFCYRRKKTVHEFATLVLSLFLIADKIADKFGIVLYDLPTYVTNMAGKAAKSKRTMSSCLSVMGSQRM
jgi:hypothetical protein